MHDPLTVAWDIRRPWPRRDSLPTVSGPRWRFRLPFTTLAGRRFYWPSLVTIWHHDPSDYDSNEVCKYSGHWKWHVHHWRIQVHPLQQLRRWALTRCEWCGGRSRRGDYVNVSHQWDHPKQPWWRGEQGLFHSDCSAIQSAHRTCLCSLGDGGPWDHDGASGPWGECAHCGGFRRMGGNAGADAELRETTTRMLAAIPTGQRDKAVTEQTRRMWDEHRAQTRADA